MGSLYTRSVLAGAKTMVGQDLKDLALATPEISARITVSARSLCGRLYNQPQRDDGT